MVSIVFYNFSIVLSLLLCQYSDNLLKESIPITTKNLTKSIIFFSKAVAKNFFRQSYFLTKRFLKNMREAIFKFMNLSKYCDTFIAQDPGLLLTSDHTYEFFEIRVESSLDTSHIPVDLKKNCIATKNVSNLGEIFRIY